MRGLCSEFLSAMRVKLESGRRKGRVGWDRHWENCVFSTVDECSPEWFLKRLQEETVELAMAIAEGNPDKIMGECADVANFAMFIADVCKHGKGYYNRRQS